ncbi:YbfB/YjiJ family MFS transporter [Desulfobotulus sp. H1]|uniref:YbfB/YjiJ family MFS transporter n=1 Tax=Desulfobotulus pelophilus TaxID=2823377 RepID=A0ABT3ND60_9BACT|nr:MFS transporter [Desulfobotulus pelophilus]MCW7755396.1 YbfB/YjiJ family MFS transporter [Desulfobotulus pelophilus]
MTDSDKTVSPTTLIPAGLSIVAATYGLARYSYGLYLPDIRADLELSIEVMGIIGSLSYAGYLAATIFGSTISGITGPRLPIVLGGLCAASGMALISISSGPWLLGLGVLLAGTSPGLAYPPLSDAITRLIRPSRQDRTYAIINSGTSIGVIISGPAALLAGEEWRWAWAGFALFAILATIWNASLMPKRRAGEPSGADIPQLCWAWLVNHKSKRLFMAASLFGISSAVYWTFAVDLLVTSGAMGSGLSRAFWILIGICGLAGGCAGDLVRLFGLRRVFSSLLIACTISILGIAFWPDNLSVALASAMLFGATFILITGLFGIWSVNTFNDRPSAGFGATFFLISAGQLIAPTLAGIIAGAWSLHYAFILAAALCLLTVFLKPNQEIYRMIEPEG